MGVVKITPIENTKLGFHKKPMLIMEGISVETIIYLVSRIERDAFTLSIVPDLMVGKDKITCPSLHFKPQVIKIINDVLSKIGKKGDKLYLIPTKSIHKYCILEKTNDYLRIWMVLGKEGCFIYTITDVTKAIKRLKEHFTYIKKLYESGNETILHKTDREES